MSDLHPSVKFSCNFLSIHPSCYTTLHTGTPTQLSLHHFYLTTCIPIIHLSSSTFRSPPAPTMYTNSNLLHICSSFILPAHSFTCHLAMNLSLSNIFANTFDCQSVNLNGDQSKAKQGQMCGEYSCTLKRISVVMVNPWVMMGSSSGGRPFQQSSSTQRHPASSVWRYISGDEIPENWPAGGEHKEGGSALAIHVGHLLHKAEHKLCCLWAEWQYVRYYEEKYSLKERWGIGTGSPGRGWNHHPWSCSRRWSTCRPGT